MEYRTQLQLDFLPPTLFFYREIPATTFSLSTLITGNYLLVEAGKDQVHYHQQLITRGRKTTDRIKGCSILVLSFNLDSLHKPLTTLKFNTSCD